MGADIYLRSKYQPNYDRIKPLFDKALDYADSLKSGTPEYKAAHAEVDRLYEEMCSIGYFRDSYNNSSLFRQLGLSWWQDIHPLLDGNRQSVARLPQFPLERVPWLRHKVSSTELDAARIMAVQGTAETYEQCVEYFEAKRIHFLALLDWSDELGEPLEMSL